MMDDDDDDDDDDDGDKTDTGNHDARRKLSHLVAQPVVQSPRCSLGPRMGRGDDICIGIADGVTNATCRVLIINDRRREHF